MYGSLTFNKLYLKIAVNALLLRCFFFVSSIFSMESEYRCSTILVGLSEYSKKTLLFSYTCTIIYLCTINSYVPLLNQTCRPFSKSSCSLYEIRESHTVVKFRDLHGESMHILLLYITIN